MTEEPPRLEPKADSPERPHRTILFAVALVGIILAWMPASYSMVWRWMGSDDYYSHGLLIPLISVYLIWLRREDLRQARIRRSWWGLLPLAFGVLGQLVSAYANVQFSTGFSLLLVLIGAVWFTYGWAVFRRVAFPLCFLAFMVPISMEMLEQVSFRMKMGAARSSASVLEHLLGIECKVAGHTISPKQPDGVYVDLPVGDPCSGLRSMIALTALGALVAYVARLALWRRVLLFLLSIPFALAGNTARIVVLALVARRWGVEVAAGNDFVHYGTGFLVFAVAVALLAVSWRILRIGRRRPAKKLFHISPPPSPSPTRGEGKRGCETVSKTPPPPWSKPLQRTALVLLVLAAAKALISQFALEELAKPYVNAAHVAQMRGVEVASLPKEAASDYLEALRMQRFARATLDVNYVLLTVVGVVFLVQGLRWARRYLQGLALLAILADLGYIFWLFTAGRQAWPASGAGFKTLLVALHLVIYAAASSASLVWTFVRLRQPGLDAALVAAAARPAEGRPGGGPAAFGRRAAASAVVTVFLAAFTWWLLRPAPAEAGLLRARNIPASLGEWRSLDRPLDPKVVKILETDDILSRRYYRPVAAINPIFVEMNVVFSRHNRRATHPPEVCLKGTGWQSIESETVEIDMPPGNQAGLGPVSFVRLVSEQGPALLVSYYTFRAGSRYTNNYLLQQWEILKLNVAGKAARGALVHFFAQVPPRQREEADRTLREFIQLSMPPIHAALEGLPPAPAPASGH